MQWPTAGGHAHSYTATFGSRTHLVATITTKYTKGYVSVNASATNRGQVQDSGYRMAKPGAMACPVPSQVFASSRYHVPFGNMNMGGSL